MIMVSKVPQNVQRHLEEVAKENGQTVTEFLSARTTEQVVKAYLEWEGVDGYDAILLSMVRGLDRASN